MNNETLKKPMTREEIITAISVKTGYEKKVVKNVMTEYENILLVDLAESHETKIGIIGKIKITERAERVGLNPITKERVIIPSKLVPKFLFSKGIKEFIANEIKK